MFPLSHLQYAQWFEFARDPKSAAFNRGTTMRLARDVDLEAFRAAWEALVLRHDSLRMVIVVRDGVPYQKVALASEPTFEIVDARAADEQQIRALAQEIIETPFDLLRGPAVRTKLLVRDEEVVFVMCHPHIYADLAVVDTMLWELGQLYDAKRAGKELELPRAERSYAEFVAWEAALLQGKTLEDLEAYWRRQLDDAPKALPLPADRPRTAGQPLRRGTHAFALLDQEENSLLERLVKSLGSSRYRVLGAAWVALLHRLTGQEDLLFGMLIDCRDRGFEHTMGNFTNVVPVRVRPERKLPFIALATQIADRVKEILRHRQFPFSMMVERLLAPSDRATTPFFQALFNLGRPRRVVDLSAVFLTSQPIPWKGQLGAISVHGAVPVHPHFSTLEVELFAVEVSGQLGAEIGYDANLFDAETIRRWAGHLRCLLKAALRDPETTLEALPLMTVEERDSLLTGWSGSNVPFTDSTMDRLFEARAAATPNAVALEQQGAEPLTYCALDGFANRLATTMRERGVTPGSFVGVLLERTPAVIAAFLGAWKASAAYVPIDATYPEDRVRFMIEDARAKLVVVDARTRHLVPPGTAVLDLDADRAEIERASSALSLKETTSRSLAYVIYTSGSTGLPKGVLIEHRGVCNYAEDVGRRWQVGPGSRVFGFASFSFDSSVADYCGALAAGATLHMRRGDVVGGVGLARAIREARATHAQLPPAVWGTIPEGEKLEAVTTVITSGDAVSQELIARWAPGRTMLNEYGPTEITVCATSYRCTPGAPLLIGKPISNVRCFVLDPELEPVPIGVAGELCLTGVGIARGYLGRDELTREKFVTSPFDSGERIYRTGDRARWTVGGELEFLGRFDDQVKVRGFRIELGEIESALRSIPGVAQSVVVVRDGEDRGKHLVGYYVLEAAGGPTDTEVRAILRKKLAPYMVPSHLIVLPKLPLTAHGKVDRAALPAPAADAPAHAANGDGASAEDRVLAVFRRLLGAPSLHLDADFFESGGDSLLAVELAADVSDILGSEVSILTVFEAPTPRKLAARGGAGGEAATGLVDIRAGDDAGSPIFCPHAGGGDVLAYFGVAQKLDRRWPVVGIRSRGLADPDREAESIEQLAVAYADEIAARQPVGPIRLFGWSMGGVIAVGIARELEGRGRKVAFVGVIDGHVLHPGSPLGDNPFLRVAADIGEVAGKFGNLPERELLAIGRELLPLPEGARFEAALRIARDRGLVGAAEKPSFDERAARLARKHNAMLAVYTPPPVNADIHYWRASESPPDPSAIWAGATRGRLVEAVLPGNHYSVILAPAHVVGLARVLSEALAPR